MARLIPILLAAAVVILQTAPAAQVQRPPRDAVERQAAEGVLRGRIVAADTGAPLRRAQVRASSSTERGTRLTMTDADGRFEFSGLRAGRWNLTASKAGYVTMRFGQRRPFENGTPIELDEGQTLERVDFVLPRGAAITGRVFDEYGEPVANTRVQALRYQLVQGSRRLVPTGAIDQTDDTGSFRLFDLMPGDYYVSAVLRTPELDDPADLPAYAPTYFPGTGTMSEAQRISLGIAEETDIAFSLLPVRTATISGIVLDASGNPLAGGQVRLASAEPGGTTIAAFENDARVRGDGTFEIAQVPPGLYTAVARSGGRGGAQIGSATVAIAGEHVSGLLITTTAGASLSGIVTVAPGAGERTVPAAVQVITQGVGADVGLGGRPGRIGEDGSFQVTNLFGPRLVRVRGLPPDWMLERVVIGGRDVTDAPIVFGTGNVTGARITVTDRVSEVTGTVVGRDGRPTRDYSVVVFPDDEAMWTFPSRHVLSARPDQQGVFRLRALPAYERYLAIAVDYLEQGEAADPRFLEQARALGTPFSLDAGGAQTLSLRLVER